MFEFLAPLLCFGLIGGIGFLSATIRIVQEYERAVIFRLGKVQKEAKGPGIFFVWPIIDRLVKVSLRTVTLDVPAQEAITGDNVTVKVNAVVYYRVLDPVRAIIEIEDYNRATWQIAQTSLRNVIGQSHLDKILQDREHINETLQHIIDDATEPWGVKVSIVEIKDVELNSQMVRAMAREAEAERERRAKVIHATGELQASEQLALAARRMNEEHGAMTLRYLQTLVEIGVEQNTTTIFPIPMELLTPFLKKPNSDPDAPSVPTPIINKK
ncbi:MAG TPA: SPFH domain-containing protein [Anaerolineae bacterium]|nr:SPFH domain-containing protein [Anaerolineae bacterium]